MAGTGVDYAASPIVAKAKSFGRPSAASQLVVGKRFPSAQVATVSSGLPRQLCDVMAADGRWRIVAFAGDVREPSRRMALDTFVQYLDSAEGVVSRYTPADADRDSIFDVLTVVASPRIELDYESFPDALRPVRGPHRLREHNKVFADCETYRSGHGRAYELYGVGADGALVVIRPDGYISAILGFEQHALLDQFFAGFML